MKKKESVKFNFAEWLEKLQQESWQLELLISGFAIFGLFELLGFINSYISTSFLITIIAIIVNKAVYIFIVNLLIHVFLRSLWIGAIGLRYVSGDIDYEKLNYSPKFTNYFKRKIGHFDDYIEKLEQWASVLFSYTFLLFFMFFSFFFLFIIFVVATTIAFNSLGGSAKTGLTNFRIDETPDESLWTYIALAVLILNLLACLLVLFDFVTAGLLKRVRQRHFSALFLLVYRYISFVTLSFVWRPLLLNFLDKRFTRRLFIISVPYVILLTMVLPSTRYSLSGYYPATRDLFTNQYPDIHRENSYKSNFYGDEVSKQDKNINRIIQIFNIPSKRVKGRLFEIFIRYNEFNEGLVMGQDTSIQKITKEGIIVSKFLSASYDSDIDLQPIMDSIEAKNITDETIKQKMMEDYSQEMSRQKKKQYLTNYEKIKRLNEASFLIEIDDKQILPSSIECDYYIHPNLKEKGMLCFMPIDSMSIGRHYLTVGKIGLKEPGGQEMDTIRYRVPFIYEGL